MRAGFVQYWAEKVVELADGQGNPPEVTTGTLWLTNTAAEHGGLVHMALVQVPETVAAPAVVEVALQVWPRMLAVHTTPPCGMVRLEVPPEDADKLQLPFVLFEVQVAEKVKPEALTVHPVKVGLLIAPVIGCPEPEDVALPLVDDPVQFTVAVPSLKVTLVPEHNEAVKGPVGETESADAAWAPRPSTAATKPRVMRICVAFML